MFHSARIKLTAWYLLIIMSVSLTFSFVIYRAITHEVERFDRIRALRLEHRIPVQRVLLPPPLQNPELVAETKNRVLTILFLINSGIFVLSGGLGYFLAGRTLTPIKEMIDEQNRFIADASHELKTPLTSLKTAFEVYLRNKHRTLQESETIIAESIEEVNKLQSLAQSLLELSHYENANQAVFFEPVIISDVIEGAIRRVSPMAQRKKMMIINKTKPITLQGDKTRLTDLFVILLDNAIKYSPDHSKVTVEMAKKDKGVTISVADQGIGIDEKDLPHIFDRFYRADAARSKTGGGGYGLGLSIAKKIADIHNGSIRAESKIHKGSNFTVRLPLKGGENT